LNPDELEIRRGAILAATVGGKAIHTDFAEILDLPKSVTKADVIDGYFG
jgi:hypothetical protein